jgi:hypothetical protein
MSWSRKGLKAMSALRAYLCSGGRVRSEHLEDTNQESKRAGKKGYNFTLNLGEIFSSATSELGCITVLGTGKVTPLYTTLKGICHGGFDF